MTTHVLFLCTHNSARSVMAEAMLNSWAQRLHRDVQAYSAGSMPGDGLHEFAVEALLHAGIDTDNLYSKSWDVFAERGAPRLSIIITVCDIAAAESCPVFHGGAAVKVHWNYPDPAHAPGSDVDKRLAFDLTRQALAYRILQLLALPLDTMEPEALRHALGEIGLS